MKPIPPLVLSLALVTACGGDGSGGAGTVAPGEANLPSDVSPSAPVDSDVPTPDVDDDASLISTWALEESGNDREIPRLEPRVRIPMPTGMQAATLSPDGEVLAISSEAEERVAEGHRITVSLHDTRDGAVRGAFEAFAPRGRGRHRLLWSEGDVLTLVSGVLDAEWRSWDVASGELLQRRSVDDLPSPCDFISGGDHAVYDPARNILWDVIALNGENPTLCRLDLNAPSLELAAVPGPARNTRSLLLSADATRLAVLYRSVDDLVLSGGTLLHDVDTLQPTGESYPLEEGQIRALGSGFRVDDELVVRPDGAPLDSSFGTISTDRSVSVLASKRPDYSGDDRSTRFVTLPAGIVIGDVPEASTLDTRDFRTFSSDGALVAIPNGDAMDIYTLAGRTRYTARRTVPVGR